jgi:hypothetical protein
MPGINRRPRTRRASNRSNIYFGKSAHHVGFPLQIPDPNDFPQARVTAFHKLAYPRILRPRHLHIRLKRPFGSSTFLVSRFCASVGASFMSVRRHELSSVIKGILFLTPVTRRRNTVKRSSHCIEAPRLLDLIRSTCSAAAATI